MLSELNAFQHKIEKLKNWAKLSNEKLLFGWLADNFK